MTRTAGPGTPGLLRCTITAGGRRVDLVLPGAVPVAELMPELARSVGLLDRGASGLALMTAQGRRLSASSSLLGQGVDDGSLLCVVSADDDVRVTYDDPAEAVADAVAELPAWTPALAGLVVTLAVAALSVASAAAWFGAGSERAAYGAGLAAAGLVAAALGVSRARIDSTPHLPVALLLGGSLHAGVASALMVGDRPGWLGLSALWAGVAIAAVGVIGLVALTARGAISLAAVVAGAGVGVVGLLTEYAEVAPVAAAAGVVTVLALLGGVLPWAALQASGLRTATTNLDSAEPVDLDRVRADLATSQDVLLGLLVGVGGTTALLAPVVVADGVWGSVLVAVVVGLLVLRARHYATAETVAVGVLSGLTGLAVAVGAAVAGDTAPEDGVAVVTLIVLALGVLAVLGGASGSLRRDRLRDVAETVCLLALPPLFVMVSGLWDLVR